jgi:light-regulated signal transduction histidine kinase (bacteriophytochrome)
MLQGNKNVSGAAAPEGRPSSWDSGWQVRAACRGTSLLAVCRFGDTAVASTSIQWHFIRGLPILDATGVRGGDPHAIAHIHIGYIGLSQGGPVRVTAQRSEREVTVQVRDNRIGISHEDLPHVFEPYFRGRNIGRSDGPGLGSEFVAEDDATV